MIRVYLACCPSCNVYARYLIDRGPGWALIFCPVCDPVLVAQGDAILPAWYAHLLPLRPLWYSSPEQPAGKP